MLRIGGTIFALPPSGLSVSGNDFGLGQAQLRLHSHQAYTFGTRLVRFRASQRCDWCEQLEFKPVKATGHSCLRSGTPDAGDTASLLTGVPDISQARHIVCLHIGAASTAPAVRPVLNCAGPPPCALWAAAHVTLIDVPCSALSVPSVASPSNKAVVMRSRLFGRYN